MKQEVMEIEMVRRKLIESIKRNQFKDMEKLLCRDLKIGCYTTGTGEGPSALKSLFTYPGPQPFDTKVNVENKILRYEGKRAQQSFHLIMLYAVRDEAGQFHFMQYGGTFVISYRKEERWKISKILFDLCWLDGNSFWVESWNMLNFHEPQNHQPVIQKKDSVWRTIPCCSYERTGEEQIQECLYHFGWVTDFGDYELLQEIALKDVKIKDGYHHQYIESAEEWAEFLKGIYAKEPRLHHTYRIREIKIEGETATAKMSRVEPNRIGSKAIGEHNYFMDWFTMDCNIELVKLKDRWKIKRVEFIKHIYSEPVLRRRKG